GPRAPRVGDAVRPRRAPAGRGRDGADARRSRAPVDPRRARPRARGEAEAGGRGRVMGLVTAVGIGVSAAGGVGLVPRPRTFQVLLGLSLLTYAVNAFLLAMGGLPVGAPPVLGSVEAPDPAAHADPLPQSLVLTSIVISFSMTALYLVVLLTARGLTGTDHVDGEERV